MAKLDLKMRLKRDTPLTVRLPKASVDKLRKIAEKHGVSQADVVEQLIENAHEELGRKR